MSTKPIEYIRFETHSRFHGVLISLEGDVAITYCARVVAGEQIRGRLAEPNWICGACRARIRKPNLIPASLRKAKDLLDGMTSETSERGVKCPTTQPG